MSSLSVRLAYRHPELAPSLPGSHPGWNAHRPINQRFRRNHSGETGRSVPTASRQETCRCRNRPEIHWASPQFRPRSRICDQKVPPDLRHLTPHQKLSCSTAFLRFCPHFDNRASPAIRPRCRGHTGPASSYINRPDCATSHPRMKRSITAPTTAPNVQLPHCRETIQCLTDPVAKRVPTTPRKVIGIKPVGSMLGQKFCD